ncbi:hypothetical protein MM236_07835 [Belliella sp. DSM 107340]|uniref:TolB-like 6-blade propeller-like n=1 Tax=Belliella calami TaxID=2923436 RepID=A0ABS9UMP3_9BACT|nr:hypothetical protein [Belliella calami]MCH7397894.1 hypothetical protein [Belliella calami]
MKKIFFFCIIIGSCNPKSNNTLEELIVEKTILNLDFGNDIYDANPSFYGLNNNYELLVYDRNQAELQLFEINSNKKIKINLEFSGPNSIDKNIFSLYKEKENLHICSGNSVVIADIDGKKLKEVFYHEILEKLKLQNHLYSLSIIPKSNWNVETNDLFLWLKAFNSHESKFKIYNEFIEILRYNVISDSSEILKLKVPENLIQESNQGYYQGIIPHISVKNNTIVYAFPNFDDVFIYNQETKEIINHKITPKSFKQSPPTNYENYGKTGEIVGEVYTRILDIAFDYENRLIYRLHSQIQDGKLIGHRKLTILNLQGEHKEVDLTEESGVRLQTSNGKLYIIQRDIPDENSLRLNQYEIKLD